LAGKERLHHRGTEAYREDNREDKRSARKKNAGLEAATLISAFNPVSQVLW
jgi:hypothetical protein